MPSIKESLQMQLQLELSRKLSTHVPSQLLVESAADCAARVATWLAEVYDAHSVQLEVYGQAQPLPVRPSFEWLCESMRE